MENEGKRIIEIDGIKVEVDLRTAKRVDTFRVGDNVKVLDKAYSEYKVRPGVIVDFANFKEKPTIVVAIFDEGSWSSEPSIRFIHIYDGSEDKYEIVPAGQEELKLSKETVVQKFERAIEERRAKMEDLENQLRYFKKRFLKDIYEVENDETN